MLFYSPSDPLVITPIKGDRVIRDCERDVKGEHDWKYMMQSGGIDLLWCLQCGAIGERRTGHCSNANGIRVIRRVKE